jgi:catechol 2,3-dioxygenase-like lactoylglutathione lyase family enzyme
LNKGLYPAIAVGASGTLWVVWHDEPGDSPDQHELYYTSSTDGGATWSSSQRFSWTSHDSEYPAIAADPLGDLHVAFRDSTPGNFEVYYKRSTDEGANWWSIQRLTHASGEAKYPAISADSLGNPHVVWYEDTPGNDEIFYRKSTDKGALWSWTAQKRLTWNSGESAHPAIRVDSSGNPHVAWYDNTPGNLEIFYRKSTDGGTSWMPSKRLTWDSEWSWTPSIAIDYLGNIHVVWYKYTGPPQNMDIFYRSWVK